MPDADSSFYFSFSSTTARACLSSQNTARERTRPIPSRARGLFILIAGNNNRMGRPRWWWFCPSSDFSGSCPPAPLAQTRPGRIFSATHKYCFLSLSREFAFFVNQNLPFFRFHRPSDFDPHVWCWKASSRQLRVDDPQCGAHARVVITAAAALRLGRTAEHIRRDS